MKAPPVFSFEERTDWTILRYRESQFEFLDRCAWPVVGLVRDWIREWIVPFEGDKEFISKFSSKSDKQHAAAVFEMLVFAIFRNCGQNIQRVERTGEKTTDFLILGTGASKTYLECSLAANAMEPEEERRKMESIIQYVEEIPDYPFYVGFEFNKLSNHSISKKQLLTFLEKFRFPYSFEGPLHKVSYSAQGWDLAITLIRKGDGAFGRTRGFNFQAPKMIDNFKALYGALNGKKAGRYKLGTNPYVICLAVDDMTANEYEFFSVLFGPQDMERATFDWKMNGFFMVNGEPVNKSVSAVLFCKWLEPFRLLHAELSLWHNPFATYPVTEIGLPVKDIRYIQGKDGLLRSVRENSQRIIDVLGKDDELYIKYLAIEYRRGPEK
jgi:hypothetical protein